MPFGLWTRVGPRKDVLGGAHTGTIWQIPLNCIKLSICSSDAAFCQITLTTCLYSFANTTVLFWRSKVKIDLCSTLSWETHLFSTQVWHVLTRDHTVLPPPTHLSMWKEPHLLLLPSHRASLHFDRYSFSVPLWVEGWVGLSGCLQTEVVYPPADSHPSSTNRAWHTVTALIETNALQLSQAVCNCMWFEIMLDIFKVTTSVASEHCFIYSRNIAQTVQATHCNMSVSFSKQSVMRWHGNR